MAEEGFDLSTKLPQSVFELFKAGKLFDHVVTVCSDSEDQCPLFPGITKRWHWPFPDPAKGVGADDEKLAEVRRIRDMIKDWLQNPPPGAIDFQSLIDEFVEAVKDKGSGEVIALAVEEATRADRMFYRACRCSGDHCSCEDKYSRHLKRLIGYLRYTVKPRRRNDEVYQLYTAHWGNA
jgi:hypothetical protein